MGSGPIPALGEACWRECIVAPGDGEVSGQLLRINHFGANASREGVEGGVRTLAGLLKQDAEQAVQAIRQVWGEAL